MDLFPDLGAWLFRSVRRDSFAESPVLAVQRLKLLSQPIGDSDKDVLVGAVLNLGSSLSQALHILLELLPEDQAGERLGEIVCPTLGQLLVTLQTTLSAFECRAPSTRHVSLRGGRLKHSRSESALRSAAGLSKITPRPLTPILMKRTPPETPKTPRPREGVVNGTRVASSPLRFTSPATKHSRSHHARKDTEEFPRLHDELATPHQREPSRQPPTPPASNKPETFGLQNALKSELRVQAAIRVAVDSLEFAEGQLQLVKEINHLHGGSFDLMQRNFYSGYNNLLLRALELEQLEAEGLASRPISLSHSVQAENAPRSSHQRQQASIHVSFQANMPTPPHRGSSPHRAGDAKGMATSDSEAEAGHARRNGITRRNTIQGVKVENDRDSARPAIKRRLSLAEELALAGEDTDSYDSGGDHGDESAAESATEEASLHSESQADSNDDDDAHYDSEQHGEGGESSNSSQGMGVGEGDGRDGPLSKEMTWRFQGR
ncbi:hypothetical protein QBC40DRAFT_289707 [Triangularia verruculosa]|uniref:Uncharacterized protein n=1 Tax=Triangularia verruculosa TaxID=2587418 RepID=A0AAN7AQ50_9PEZI|nr:hypothetical protein QBC40DRAFT_289707 [Triangularia verruculosa]